MDKAGVFWLSLGKLQQATAVAFVKEGKGLIRVNGSPIGLVEPQILRMKVYEPVSCDGAYGEKSSELCGRSGDWRLRYERLQCKRRTLDPAQWHGVGMARAWRSLYGRSRRSVESREIPAGRRHTLDARPTHMQPPTIRLHSTSTLPQSSTYT